MDKRLVWLVAFASIVFVIYAGYRIWYNQTYGTLNLDIVPFDAEVVINGERGYSSGKITLRGGEHRLEISREGFDSQSANVTVTAGKTNDVQIVLLANSAVGLKWLEDHPDQARKAEGIAGKEVDEKSASLEKKYPIIKLLPYFVRDFRIDYGSSQQHPDDDSKIALYITAPTPETRQEALDWIASQGYNPSDFEIIYID